LKKNSELNRAVHSAKKKESKESQAESGNVLVKLAIKNSRPMHTILKNKNANLQMFQV